MLHVNDDNERTRVMFGGGRNCAILCINWKEGLLNIMNVWMRIGTESKERIERVQNSDW